MTTRFTLKKRQPSQQSAETSYRHLRSRTLKVYADWRVGATHAEKFAYRKTTSVLLTFDDYGTPDQVTRLLAVLADAQTQAMFFLQGSWADEHPGVVAQIRAAGHVIGNHTYSHPNLLELSESEVADEIRRGPKGSFFRPPMGKYNDKIRQQARAAGMKIAYWTIDSDDWQGMPASYMREKIIRQLHPGAVILFHMHCDTTIAALPSIIAAIRHKGYELDPIAE